MIKLIMESFDDDHIKNTRKHMSDREAERYIKKILRDNSIDLHDYHGNVGGIGWICIETYERGLPDGWKFTDDLTGISAYIDLDGNILRRYDDLETVYSNKYYRSQGGTRDIPESIRVMTQGMKESVSDKLELQDLAENINNLNDDRSWVELDATIQKRERSATKFQYICKVIVTNHSYTVVSDEYRVVPAHRGGFVIHSDNPIKSEWFDTKDKVLGYFEEMVALNIEEDF